MALVDDQCTRRQGKNNISAYLRTSSSNLNIMTTVFLILFHFSFLVSDDFFLWTLSCGSSLGVEIMPVLTSGSVARFRDQV